MYESSNFTYYLLWNHYNNSEKKDISDLIEHA